MVNPRSDRHLHLPALELQCMKALWSLGQGTVREIRSTLYPSRPLAYTTVMTVMDRLARKGMVERQKRGRAHLYRPAVPEEAVREHALDLLTENFFQGSRHHLRKYLDTARKTPLKRRDGGVNPPPQSLTVNR